MTKLIYSDEGIFSSTGKSVTTDPKSLSVTRSHCYFLRGFKRGKFN
jgi:hypothetical protein